MTNAELEEAAKKHQVCIPVDTTIYYCGADEDVYFANRIIETYIAGAKWQKEQMMKEAVEGEVIIYDGLWQIHAPNLDTFLRKMDEGDKVRMIILPKED